MARVQIFADEAGNLDLMGTRGATRYFILTTVTSPTWEVGDALLTLRRELAWEGMEFSGEFHATEQSQVVRDRVFAILSRHSFQVDATIIEKRKLYSHVRTNKDYCYKLVWWLHLKNLVPRLVQFGDELLVVGATFGIKRQQQIMAAEVRDVVKQVTPTLAYRTAYWDVRTDPCLQVADYCAWAIQRKWEGGDARSHRLIAAKVATEYDVYRASPYQYY